MELIAEEVRPHFSGANWLRKASYDRIAPNQEQNRALARVAIAEATDRFETARNGKPAL
jgi:hypothetical protein